MLAYFRSQHLNQSWLGALTTILDASAIVMLTSEGELRAAAELSFAMGRHVLVDMARHFQLKPSSMDPPRLSSEQFQEICQAIHDSPLDLDQSRLDFNSLAGLARMYEPYAHALSEYFVIAVPSWRPEDQTRENWRITNLHAAGKPTAVSDPFQDRDGDEK